ncbi:transporter substrate-binding domain-containing protein [Pseudobutyrivibrio ruminis]|uniref:transporter substrate-binding domain-containing protein n=1 Tax=Pseudobutyrivibrio ruminis TaxID=46206 RepID=UPI00051B4F26|nr:transporter substrate-binding domain-containing protein [Pseudobutyrivibrio ruminis]
MKKRLLATIMALTMAMGFVACGADQTSQTENTSDTAESTESAEASESDVAYIQEKGKLIVGITDFAPMDYKDDNGEWVGFDADMAKAVADSLGVDVEFVEIDWDNKILELENKSIDVVWNGMTLTPEVTNAMETTNAYCNNAQVIVVNADKADSVTTVDEAKELSFAVESGSAGEAAASDNGLDYVAVKSQADAVMEVAAGTSDACIIDLLMAGAMVGEGTSYPDLTHTVELTTEEYGVGCRKGSDLAAYINDQFKTLYEDGTMTEIAETYGVQDAVVEQ